MDKETLLSFFPSIFFDDELSLLFEQESVPIPLTSSHENLLNLVSSIAKVKDFQYLENGIAVAFLETHQLRQHLQNLPFPHRFLNEAAWHYSNPAVSDWSPYFLSICKTIYDIPFRITLHNPSIKHIEETIRTLLTHDPSADYTDDFLAVSQPTQQGDKTHRSILLTFERKNNSWHFFHKPIEKLQAKEVIQYVLDFIR